MKRVSTLRYPGGLISHSDQYGHTTLLHGYMKAAPCAWRSWRDIVRAYPCHQYWPSKQREFFYLKTTSFFKREVGRGKAKAEHGSTLSARGPSFFVLRYLVARCARSPQAPLGGTVAAGRRGAFPAHDIVTRAGACVRCGVGRRAARDSSVWLRTRRESENTHVDARPRKEWGVVWYRAVRAVKS